jgi:hypothetical protein
MADKTKDTVGAMTAERVDALLSTMQTPATATATETPAEQRPEPAPKLSFEGMTDPQADRDGYAAELSRRVDQHNTEYREWHEQNPDATEARMGPSGDIDLSADWARFREQHPEADEGEARRHASAVAREMALEGRSFAEIQRELPRAVSARLTQEQDSDSDGRTAGTFGGAESGGRPTAPAAQSTSFVEELKTAQESIWK